MACCLLDNFVNANNAPCPWMPEVENLALLGPVGVLSLSCTIVCGPHTSLGGLTPAEVASRSN